MGQGTDNLERINRTRPQRSEFEHENTMLVHAIAGAAWRESRRADRRSEAKRRRQAEAEHAAALAE